MRSSRKPHILLLIWIVVCVCVISCKPPGKQTSPEKSKSEGSKGQTEMTNITLSKEQIIEIANRAARRHGCNPEEMDVIYDEGNAGWRSIAVGPWPELEGHDFQAVVYWHRPPIPEGGLWVLVDRNTGQVLSASRAP
jgi:hypothetical protein